MSNISFDNTEVAFKHKSDAELKQAKWLFSMFNFQALVKYGPGLTAFCLKIGLPIKGIVKSTIFKQFCGGETIEECGITASALYDSHVGSILDYSVEGVEDEATFDANVLEIKKTITAAKSEDKFPFAVFKCTGIGRFAIFQKASSMTLTEKEEADLVKIKQRIASICDYAYEQKVPLLIDAEETWIQTIIDQIVMEMMEKYNKDEVWIYNTLQMYRVDRLAYLKETIAQARANGFKLGYKLVRGAYMEKERARAKEMNYPSPIQPDKESTDRDFDAATSLCFENRDIVSTCLGTHNEKSSMLLANLMNDNKVDAKDKRFWFAQLFGMSDNITFNLGNHGFNVAKYLPYGPVRSVLPYLGRRAQENSSVSGQVGREMGLIVKELKRRKS